MHSELCLPELFLIIEKSMKKRGENKKKRFLRIRKAKE